MLIANSCFCFFDYRGQVILRHKGWPPYRCFLPDLAGFKGSFCTGPGPLFYSMAERVGFEPTVQLPGQRFSRPPDSATLAPLLRTCWTSTSIKRAGYSIPFPYGGEGGI